MAHVPVTYMRLPANTSIPTKPSSGEVGRATIHRFLLSQEPNGFAPLRKLLETRGEGWALCLSL
jgi:hypothetical protein